ncbi:hypothetical protein CDD80_5090 [Ophiocordyceps camponoti-rufipedis]|uniref:Uncharacterized protein n=1 Tax=Ophiocordyceps camponoti-rufipedis TaxID=2004952 RepID=A0A2C5ZE80_9HYPO|nr:hypothetical protein CDD80_5090 [Ophiocordyceps camponoti-rufipedis]
MQKNKPTAATDTPISTPISTPKRKKTHQPPTPQPPVTPVKFSFDPLKKMDSPDDGSRSPRSCVAHRFRGLALNGDADDVDGADPVRKRRRFGDDAACSGLGLFAPVPFQPDVAVASTEVSAQLQSRPPRRKRAGTPPLRLKRSPAAQQASGDPELPPVADPVRAALTWHEDEITVYDPHDADDDGTGVNGVGFKPTPAMAHARVMKRRQQMADYRRREESEARARRSQRRRGDVLAAAAAAAAAAVSSRTTDKPSPRKVRFMDAENKNVAVTTV